MFPIISWASYLLHFVPPTHSYIPICSDPRTLPRKKSCKISFFGLNSGTNGFASSNDFCDFSNDFVDFWWLCDLYWLSNGFSTCIDFCNDFSTCIDFSNDFATLYWLFDLYWLCIDFVTCIDFSNDFADFLMTFRLVLTLWWLFEFYWLL